MGERILSVYRLTQEARGGTMSHLWEIPLEEGMLTVSDALADAYAWAVVTDLGQDPAWDLSAELRALIPPQLEATDRSGIDD
jgi:hypothetical protein